MIPESLGVNEIVLGEQVEAGTHVLTARAMERGAAKLTEEFQE